VDVFQQTLRILAEGIISSHANVAWDTDQVARFHEIYFKFMNATVPDVLKKQLQYIAERLLPGPSYVKEPEMEMPFPELDSEATPSSPGPSPNLSVPPLRIGDVLDSGFSDDISLTPTPDDVVLHDAMC